MAAELKARKAVSEVPVARAILVHDAGWLDITALLRSALFRRKNIRAAHPYKRSHAKASQLL
jgi:hypothetical protein